MNIESNCPVNFEYDIEIIKPHPDIQISNLFLSINLNIAPMRADVIGMQDTAIEVYYNPHSCTTAEAEISFRTTEFDSQPKLCRIVGSAMP